MPYYTRTVVPHLLRNNRQVMIDRSLGVLHVHVIQYRLNRPYQALDLLAGHVNIVTLNGHFWAYENIYVGSGRNSTEPFTPVSSKKDDLLIV